MLLKEKDIRDYLEKDGRKASQVLERLGKLDSNLHINLRTEFGREILEEDINRLDLLFCSVAEETATPKELAEFRYLKDRIDRLSRKITAYNSGVAAIQDVVAKQ